MNNGAHEQVDVIVIGGGLAGLAAATYVAQAGRRALLLERSSALGGRAMTSEASGYLFNFGPHALYRKGPGIQVLRELGVHFTGKVPPASGYAIQDGALQTVSQSPLWFLTTGLLTPRGKVEAARLLVKIRGMKARSFRDVSLRDWLEREAKHPEVRTLVGALARVATYANDPELSAEVAIMQLQGAVAGVLYLDGGWQTLVEGLRRAAEAAGARIETNAPVQHIEQDGALRRAVQLKDGRRITASAVVLATTADAAASLVDEGSAIAKAARASVPVRAACLDVGLRRLPRPERGFAMGLDEPLYLSVHSRVAKLAPQGAAMIHVAKYLAPDDGDAKAHEAQLEACLDLVQPGWRDELVERRYLPNMTVVGRTARAVDGGLASRPSVETEMDGLYLAGDWVGEAWLSDASLSTAKRAAELALARAGAPARGIAASVA